VITDQETHHISKRGNLDQSLFKASTDRCLLRNISHCAGYRYSKNQPLYRPLILRISVLMQFFRYSKSQPLYRPLTRVHHAYHLPTFLHSAPLHLPSFRSPTPWIPLSTTLRTRTQRLELSQQRSLDNLRQGIPSVGSALLAKNQSGSSWPTNTQ
jgi:hypothetical protein